MISPAQIKTKAKKIWQLEKLQQAYLQNSSIFPLLITLPKFSSRLLQEDFMEVRAGIKCLHDHCKERLGYGYEVIFKEIQHRHLGRQQLPVQIVFSTEDDFLRLIDKQKEYQQFCQLVTEILKRKPTLKTWLLNHSSSVLLFQDKWAQLLNICDYMEQRPFPQSYLRELDIPGIDTKLIEQNKKILSELFEQLLPVTAINREIIQRGAHYFEQRYGFKHDEQLIRFRMPDQSHFHDVSVPLNEFQTLSLPYSQIFITENKINGLSFPLTRHTLVIFGLGYGIQSLREISWLKTKKIIYWGDIDTHGFAMLSQLRGYYPQTESFLMDQETLKKFMHLCVEEPSEKRCTAHLKHLFPEEQILYQELQNNVWGKNIRLEQERINFNYFLLRLRGV